MQHRFSDQISQHSHIISPCPQSHSLHLRASSCAINPDPMLLAIFPLAMVLATSKGWVRDECTWTRSQTAYQYIYIYIHQSYHLKYDFWPFSFLQLIFFIASRAEANVGGTQSITLRIQSQRTRLIWYLFCVPGSSIFSARQKCTSQVGVRRGHTTNQALNWQTHPLSRIVY